MDISVRRAEPKDRAGAVAAEGKATPRLHYLDAVYEQWVADREGELIVAEADGQIVGVGKFSVVPDGSAWLEALRVPPEHQGQGIGKRFYERFGELARQKGITTMRMYTNIDNVVSKGLAERFGLRLAGTYREGTLDVQAVPGSNTPADFRPVADAGAAAARLMPLAETWAGFTVMNRTFYAISPTLCAAFAADGKVYEDTASGSVIALGARFMPEQALHLALFGGDLPACLDFARQKAAAAGIPKLKCMFSPQAAFIAEALAKYGFTIDPTAYIVMEGHLTD